MPACRPPADPCCELGWPAAVAGAAKKCSKNNQVQQKINAQLDSEPGGGSLPPWIVPRCSLRTLIFPLARHKEGRKDPARLLASVNPGELRASSKPFMLTTYAYAFSQPLILTTSSHMPWAHSPTSCGPTRIPNPKPYVLLGGTSHDSASRMPCTPHGAQTLHCEGHAMGCGRG